MRPIDADALVSDIESARNIFFRSPYERRFHEDRIEFALNMVEDVPTIDYVPRQQWISVKDRLPETFQNVLVCTKHEMLLCHHDGDEWVINYDGEYAGYDYDITHWMPLPEPPNEEA
jgi:hypothetical protein